MTQKGTRSPELAHQAARWVVLLSSPGATRSDLEAFHAWCAREPMGATAFEEAGLAWDSMAGAIRWAEQRGLTAELALPERPAGPSFGRRALLGGALFGTAAAATVLAVRPPLALWPSVSEAAADVRTRKGERRSLQLPGGPSLELNTRTSVNVREDRDGLRIELVAGEAAVSLARGANVPVTVAAGGGRTTASEARFDVRADPGLVRVTCLEGAVRVDHRGRSARLGARQQTSYGARGLGEAQAIDPAAVTAWREGFLMFRGERLAEVVDEVNRYRPGRIVLLDRALGERRVTAQFNLARLDDVIAQIQDVYGGQVRRLPAGVVLIG